MAGQRASGSMIWNLSINDAKALTSLRTMKSEVRSANNEWRALATQQSASGDMSASVRTKVSGLSEAVAKQKEYVEALSHVLKNSSQETDKDKRVYEQWRAQLNAGKSSLARMNAELKESQSIMIRYDSGVVGLAQKHKSLNEALETNVKRLQAVGKEEEASAMQTLKYQKQVEGLTDQYYRERKVMQEMVKVSGRNSKAYQEQLVRVNGLRLKLAETENTQKRYNTGIDQLVEKTHQVNNAVGSFVEKMKAEGRAFTAQAVELKQLTAKHSALVKTYKLEQQELVKIGKNSGILSKAYLEQSTKVNKLGSQVAHTGSQVQKLDQRVGGLSTKMLKAGDRAVIMSKKYAGTSKALANISRGAANVSLGLGYMVTQGVKESTKLERSYVKTKNLLVTADDESTKHISVNVGKMKSLARKMSVQYGKSQYDIAEAMQTLVKRGYSSSQALSAMKPLLQGAAASGDSLNDVLGVTTSTMEAFGLRSKNSATMLKNTKKAINEMAYSADMTSTNFGKMGVGLTYVASTAHTAGISMSETASAIGVLSNNGIEADKSGTGLRKVINSLISPSKTGAGVLKELGVQVNDTHGKMLPLNKIMAQLRDTTKNMSDSKRMDLFHSLFGTTGQASGAILVQNASALKKLNAQVERSAKANYVQRLSKKNMNNAENQVKRFKEAFKAVEIEMGVDFLPIITKASTALAGVLDHISRMGKGTKLLIAGITVGIPVIATITGMLSTIIRGARGSYTAFFNLYKFITRKSGGQDLALDKTTETIDAQTLSVEKLAESWKQANVAKGEYSGETVAQTTTEPTVSEPVSTGKGTKTSPVTTSTVAKEVKTAEKTVAKTSTKGAGLIVDKDALGAMMRKSTQEGVSKGALVFKSVVGKAFTVAMLLPVISNVMSQGAEIFKNGINSKKGKTSAWHIAGTALAGGIGAIIGGPAGALWGANIGQEIIKTVDKRLPETDKRLKQSKKKNPQYKDQVSNNGITGAYQSGDGTISNVPTKPKKSSSKIPSGVLKEAQSVNNQFSQSMVNFDKMAGTSSAKAIQSMVKRNASIYKAVYSQASSYAKKQQKDSKSNLNSFVKQGFMTKSEEQTALSREKNYYKERLKNSKSGLSALVASDKRFAKEMQTEAKQHNSSLKDIHSKANKEITGLESKRNYDVARLTNGFYVKYKGQYLTGESGIAKIKSVYAKKIAKAQKLENDQIKDENKRHEDVMSSDERQEQKKRLRALQNAQTKTDLVFSKNSKVQERLAKKLKNSVGKISDQQAGRMISASYKAMKQTTKHAEKTYKSAKKSADKKYKATVKSAEQEYFVNHSISKKQYNAIVKNAKQTRDDTVDAANDQRKKVEKQAKNQHKQIVKEAKAQSKDHLKTVDNETGKTLKGWKKYAADFSGVWNGIKKSLGKAFNKIIDIMNSGIGGIDGVIHSFGGSKEAIGKIKHVRFANGTGRNPITKPTFAMLNDGNDSPETGNREIAMLPNGQMFSPKQRNWTGVLPANTEVFTASESKALAEMAGVKHFASGTGMFASIEDILSKTVKGAVSFGKNALSGLKNLFTTATKIVKDPTSYLSGMFKEPSGTGKVMSSFAKGFYDKVIGGAKDWWSTLWGMVDLDGSGSAGGPVTHSPGSGWHVSSGFGNRGAVSSGYSQHDGVDFDGAKTVHAMNTGTVQYLGGPPANWGGDRGIGESIVVGGGGLNYIYQELNGKYGSGAKLLVKKGDQVKAGQAIAVLGPSASHVHVGATKHKMFSIPGSSTAGWLDVRDISSKDVKDTGTGKKSVKANSALQKKIKGQVGSGFWKLISKIASLYGDDAGGSEANIAGTSVKRWKPYVIKALKANGFSASDSQVNAWLQVIQRESHGDPKAINTWDSNAKAGHPSKGLVQTIGPTFESYKFKGHNNIYNGYDDLLAGINYAKHRYGKGASMFSRVALQGYEDGGLITQQQIAKLGEYNKPEMILPLTNKTRTVQLAKEALNYVDRYDTTQKKATKVESKQDDELIKQNKTIISLLKALVVGQQNGQVISLDGKAVYDNVNKRMQKNQVRSNLGKGVSLA